MNNNDIIMIKNKYFDWLYKTMCGGRNLIDTYYDLFRALYNTEFRSFIEMDKNREQDGCDLRYRFINDVKIMSMLTNRYSIDDIEYALEGPCSVLELMVALAIRIEENIMSDPNYGNRTQQWFWNMIANLGLHGMEDGSFDEEIFRRIMTVFIERRYTYDGKGSLFYVRNCPEDMRNLEIWKQLYVYLDSFAY